LHIFETTENQWTGSL